MTLTRARGVRPMRINGTWGQMWIGSAETYSSPLTEPVSKFKSSLARRPTQDEPVSQRSLFPVQLAILLALTGDVASVCPPRRKLLPLSLCSRSSVIKKRRLITIFPSLSPLVPISLLFSLFGRGKIRTRFCAPQSASSVLCMYRYGRCRRVRVRPSYRPRYKQACRTTGLRPGGNAVV